MKTSITSLMAAFFMCASAFGQSASVDLAGNWKGTLEVGPQKLRLAFRIVKAADGTWTAKLDSIDQGARDIPVDSVTLKGKTVRMEVKLISGVYEGTLDDAGGKLTGEWQQGVAKLPLQLVRSTGAESDENETLSGAELEASKLAASKLAGTWNGSLAVGSATLRLRVNVSKAATGAAKGTMDSLGQGAKDIPLSAITLKNGTVRFEARGIGGVFEGKLADDSAAISGQWQQGGKSLPLKLEK